MTLRSVNPSLYFFLLITMPCTAWKGVTISAQKQFSEPMPLTKRVIPKKKKKKSRKPRISAQEPGEDSLHTLLNLVLLCLLILGGLILRRLWRVQDISIPLPHPYDSDHKEYRRKVKSPSTKAKDAPAP